MENFVVSRDPAVPSTVTMKWTDPSKYAVCGSGVAKLLPNSELHYAKRVGVPRPRAGIEPLLCVVQTRMWAEHKYSVVFLRGHMCSTSNSSLFLVYDSFWARTKLILL